jgi:hypothetical protein
MKSVIAAVGAVVAALYELYAIVTNEVPTITEAIEAGPDWVEVTLIGGLIAWLAWHFGWLTKEEEE